MNRYFRFFISLRWFKAKKNESFITTATLLSIIGITIGVATLIVVRSVYDGFKNDFIEKIVGINDHMAIYNPASLKIDNHKKIADKISSIKNVKHSYSMIEKHAVVTDDENAHGIMIKGMYKNDLKRKTTIDIIKGSLSPFDKNSKNIVIGKKLSNKLGIDVGDSIMILSPSVNLNGFGMLPRMKNFDVCAIFDAGFSPYNENIVFMDFDMTAKFFDMENYASSINIVLKKPFNIPREVQNEVNDSGNDHFYVSNWLENDLKIISSLQTESNIMFIILSLIIMIASFNILSSLTMLVKNKDKEIAILKTIGIRMIDIKIIFLYIGIMIGAIGIFFGTILGILFCKYIDKIKSFIEYFVQQEIFSEDLYMLTKIPAKLNYNEISIICITAFILSLLASIIPARSAARLSPIAILRFC